MDQGVVDGLAALIANIFGPINNIVWGPVMLVLLLGVGFFLMLRLKFMPIRKLPMGFLLLWRGRKGKRDQGELSPFNALMTALAATIGTGNIAGVATAIFLGGPGAVFWMWCTAFVGMATKFTEVTLAVKYREVTPDGSYVGGPMYYIRKGLGENWKWLATIFAIFGCLAGFGIGSTVQVNSIADALNQSFHLPNLWTGLVLFFLVALVVLGGVRRIGTVAGKVVPFMALFYIIAAIICLVIKADHVPAAFAMIFNDAFNPSAIGGGLTGGTLAMAIRYGVARGVFSNEAGMGSAPIAHATAQTNNPVRQGLIGMLGTFLDTIVVCTMTALVILVSDTWNVAGAPQGAKLSAVAFSACLPGDFGHYIVSIGLTLFAFTTILGWCVYSERCAIYLFGHKALKPFRLVYAFSVPIGAIAQLDTVWLMADTFNALMIIPNVIALTLLSPIVVKMVRDYFTIGEHSTEMAEVIATADMFEREKEV